MKKSARIEIKVDPEWKDKVVKTAKKTKRSVANFIQVAVDKEIKKEEDDEWLNG